MEHADGRQHRRNDHGMRERAPARISEDERVRATGQTAELIHAASTFRKTGSQNATPRPIPLLQGEDTRRCALRRERRNWLEGALRRNGSAPRAK